MDMVGLSEDSGSWKTTPMPSPRTFLISRSGSVTRSVPSNRMLPPVMAPPAGQQPEDRHRGHRLARAGLADDAEHLALVQVEGNPVDGVHLAPPPGDDGVQVADLQQHRRPALHLVCWRRASSESRRASPMKLNATTVSTMARPGG